MEILELTKGTNIKFHLDPDSVRLLDTNENHPISFLHTP